MKKTQQEDFNPVLQKVKILADSDEFIPSYKTEKAAAADLVANIPEGKVTILSNRIVTIDLGFKMALPPGWQAEIKPRSGLSQRGVHIALGTIDEDYRGRMRAVVMNLGKEIIVINHGERIAQLSLKPVFKFDWEKVDQLDETERGEGGFGSTGL
ncbi:MAG: dUTP diphosphatase [bacterium]